MNALSVIKQPDSWGHPSWYGATHPFLFLYSVQLLPAVEQAISGMRVGGKRRILVPPALGFTSASTLPQPTSAAAGRRLKTVENKPFLFEIEVIRIRKP